MTNTTRTVLIVGAMLAGSVTGYACQKTAVEAHEDGVAAQREADEKITEAQKEGADKAAEAHREGAAATDKANKAAAEAQATANEKIRDSNRTIVAEPNEARSWGQKEIDSVDNMIDAASVKAQTTPAKTKDSVNTAMVDVKRQRDVLSTDLAALETSTGDKLDKSKAEFTQRVDRIKTSIQNIEKMM
jgi:regulator of protease activity HflC (stomatin/prohibitin superfamily)